MTQGAAPNWNSIGIELLKDDNDVRQLSIISLNYPADHKKCCNEMFKYWLGNDPEATWQKLLDALRSQAVGLKVLAHEVGESM